MTWCGDECDISPNDRAPGDLDRAVSAVQQHAFAALLRGDAPRVTEVVAAASRESAEVARAVGWLEDHGRLERDGDRLVGAHGLTLRPTAHVLVLGERALHTWCAYDAVAIPVVLGATARASTTCPTCGTTVVVDVEAGHLPDTTRPVLWMPRGPCEHVIADFCSHANLFCDPDHLDTWRRSAANPAGDVLTLGDIPALARVTWADIAGLR